MGAWHGRLPAWLRILVLAAAVTGLIGCARWAGEAYDGAVAYRRAPLCASAPGPDCVARVTGTVIDTETGESCTTDSDGVRSCTPYYRLRVRYGDRTAWRDVGHGTYEDTHRGDPARLRTWHGAVVRLEVHGHTETSRRAVRGEHPGVGDDGDARRLLHRVDGHRVAHGVAVAAVAAVVNAPDRRRVTPRSRAARRHHRHRRHHRSRRCRATRHRR